MVIHLRNFIYLIIFICLVICTGERALAESAIIKPQITQWVKIINKLYQDDLVISTNVENLESSSIDCGYKCKIIKLSTTPFSNEGLLKVHLADKNCYGDTTVPVLFNIQDNALVTPTKSYNIVLGSEYCKWWYLKADVTGDPHSETGYSVELKMQ